MSMTTEIWSNYSVLRLQGWNIAAPDFRRACEAMELRDISSRVEFFFCCRWAG
jgi:hypothetical protein